MKNNAMRTGLTVGLILMLGGALVGSRANSVLAGWPAGPPSEGSQVIHPPVPETPSVNPKLDHILWRLTTSYASAALQDLIATLSTSGALTMRDGQLCVIAEVADPTLVDGVAALLSQLGASEETRHGNLLQIRAPVSALLPLTDRPEVRMLRRPFPVRRLGDVPAALLAAGPRQTGAAGNVTSEGVPVIGADVWQQAGFAGQGVTVAVVDQGFQGYQALLGGELPASVNTRSFRADGDITGGGEVHGTAVAEILVDVAPAISLWLVNFGTDVEWLNAVDFAIAQGVAVVSSSIGFFAGPFDGTGPIAEKVVQARNAGILWAQSSGNEAIGHWHGEFSDADADGLEDFAPGVDLDVFSLTPGQSVQIILSWDDWPVSDQDYNLLLYSQRAGQWVLVDQSATVQSGTQPPIEGIFGTSVSGGTFGIGVQKANATRNVHLQLYTSNLGLQFQVASESLVIPADSPGAVATGATAVDSDALEPFSSQGPTTDGRVKPDLAAPDAVSTVTYGPRNFLGTSASAPHLAGAAALVLSANPSLGPAQLQSLLEQRAVDLGPPGKDNLYGAGRLNLGPPPGGAPGPAGSVDAKIEIVFPHDQAGNPQPVAAASLANVGAFLFAAGTLNPVACGLANTVTLFRALNTGVAQQVAVGTRQQVTRDGKQVALWTFNDVDVTAATDPSNRYFFFLSVAGVAASPNVWAHGADARTIFPQQQIPTGTAPAGGTVDARIQVVFPHDAQGNPRGVTEATLVNVGVDLFAPDSGNALAPDANLTVRLFRSLNNGVEQQVGTGTKTSVNAGAVTYARWVFNDVDVSASRDPLNKYYFRVDVDGMTTRSSIWSHGADARTLFPTPDVPAASCG